MARMIRRHGGPVTTPVLRARLLGAREHVQLVPDNLRLPISGRPNLRLARALALGETLPATGKLLGHAHVETTARYAHLARDSMHEAAARVADSISGNIL